MKEKELEENSVNKYYLTTEFDLKTWTKKDSISYLYAKPPKPQINPNMKKYTLSKTGYISYLACPEEYWMSLHQKELMPPFSLDAQHKVEQGKLIDKLAQQWFLSGLVLGDETIAVSYTHLTLPTICSV